MIPQTKMPPRFGFLLVLLLAAACACAMLFGASSAGADDAADERFSPSPITVQDASSAEYALIDEVETAPLGDRFCYIKRCTANGEVIEDGDWDAYDGPGSPNAVTTLFVGPEVESVPAKYSFIYKNDAGINRPDDLFPLFGDCPNVQTIEFLVDPATEESSCKEIAGGLTTTDDGQKVMQSAFCGLDSLESVVGLEKTPLTTIGQWAFGVSSIKSLNVPSTLMDIGEGAFYRCGYLTEIGGLDQTAITEIASQTFMGCAGLSAVTLPSSVTTIGGYAFDGCKSFESVTVQEGVEEIGEKAFADCSALKRISVPATVVRFGQHAFTDMALGSTIVVATAQQKSFLEDGAYYTADRTTVQLNSSSATNPVDSGSSADSDRSGSSGGSSSGSSGDSGSGSGAGEGDTAGGDSGNSGNSGDSGTVDSGDGGSGSDSGTGGSNGSGSNSESGAGGKVEQAESSTPVTPERGDGKGDPTDGSGGDPTDGSGGDPTDGSGGDSSEDSPVGPGDDSTSDSGSNGVSSGSAPSPSSASYAPTSSRPVSLASAQLLNVKNKAYTGKAAAPVPMVVEEGNTLSAGVNYTVSYRNAKGKAIGASKVKAVGSYKVVVTGINGYAGSVEKAFKITKAKASKFKVSKVKAQKLRADGKAVKPAVTVKFAGKKLKKGKDYSLAYKSNSKVGTAKIIIKGKGKCFTGTKTVKFKIRQG